METKRQKTGGRKAGTPNVTTVRTKEALQMAFDDLGGVAALVEFGKQYPADFYRLWVKLLPTEVNVTSPDDRTVTVNIGSVERPVFNQPPTLAHIGHESMTTNRS